MKKPDKSERDYKNIKDYINAFCLISPSKIEIPCIKCNGYGYYKKREEGDCYDGVTDPGINSEA